jgi:hypothetical protein
LKFRLSLQEAGVYGKVTEAPCAVLCKLYAAPHTHAQETNIPQHRACEEKRQHHIETDAKAAPKHPTEPNPQTVMWQLRKNHTPKRKKQQPKNQLKQEKQTQLKILKIKKEKIDLLIFCQENADVTVAILGNTHLNLAWRLLNSASPNLLINLLANDQLR